MSKAKNKDKKNKGTKENKNNKSLLNGVKSLTSNKKVLYSLLGAAGAGIAIAALGKDRRRSITDSVTSSVQGLGGTLGLGGSGNGNTSGNASGNGSNKPAGQ